MHARLRRGVANAFAPPAVLQMEGLVDDTSALLIETLKERKVVDLSRQSLWYSLDVAGRTAFSEDFGLLRDDADVGDVAKFIHGVFLDTRP
jgi:cytochrome P450